MSLHIPEHPHPYFVNDYLKKSGDPGDSIYTGRLRWLSTLGESDPMLFQRMTLVVAILPPCGAIVSLSKSQAEYRGTFERLIDRLGSPVIVLIKR